MKIDDVALNESRTAPLYHFTSLGNLASIIQSGELRSRGTNPIYFTRDYSRQFIPHANTMMNTPFGLQINQELLSRTYGGKLQPMGQMHGAQGTQSSWNEKTRQRWLKDPKNAKEIQRIKGGGYSYSSLNGASYSDIIAGTINKAKRWESEEVLHVPSIPDAMKYVTGIVIGDSSKDVDPKQGATDSSSGLINVLAKSSHRGRPDPKIIQILDFAIGNHLPIIYKRKKFDPALIKNQLASQAKKLSQRDAYDEVYENSDEEHHAELKKTGFWGKRGAGCLFFAMDTRRLCIAHRSDEVEQPGTWGTWGGAIDRNESPEQAVTREAREEAGYAGKLELEPLFVFKHSSGFTYYNFLAVVEREFKPHLDWESQGFVWTTFGKWPTPLHPGLALLLKDPGSVATIKNLVKGKL